jgi:hypothetical protein
MSYYNQPDHPLIDRRDDEARGLLVRLARSATKGLEPPSSRPSVRPSAWPSWTDPALTRWAERARELGLPRPDAEALMLDGVSFPLVWRSHYVVVALGAVDAPVAAALDDRGISPISFGDDDGTWGSAFEALSKALGR